VDLVFSSLALQWCASPGSAFAGIARVLRPGGMALIAVPGPATLWELRAAWQAVDGRDHVNRFLPLTALLAAAGAAGLHAENIEREDRIERHPDARSVVRGLRAIGANTLDAERSAGLGGRAAWARLDACYAEFADAGEGMPATWELLRLVLRRPYV
jgi:malonyl-CoA O-methyltransferase